MSSAGSSWVRERGLYGHGINSTLQPYVSHGIEDGELAQAAPLLPCDPPGSHQARERLAPCLHDAPQGEKLPTLPQNWKSPHPGRQLPTNCLIYHAGACAEHQSSQPPHQEATQHECSLLSALQSENNHQTTQLHPTLRSPKAEYDALTSDSTASPSASTPELNGEPNTGSTTSALLVPSGVDSTWLLAASWLVTGSLSARRA
ncbi:hypothetical protein E2C01_058809 [Portunus trituberculatus]|uniref:Uncharacterized protein n=1 Tax=Portunus trituberculatus TaxID=210409 RepID=A0A5B7H488_PORTR|nr:hypothetical protein [Portunus trituberculatus]